MKNKIQFSDVEKNGIKDTAGIKSDMDRLFSVPKISSYGKNIEEQYQVYKKEEKIIAALSSKI